MDYRDGSEYIGGLKVVDGSPKRHGLGTLSDEKGTDKILYKYEGPWKQDCMGDGPGELLVYIIANQKNTTSKEDEEEIEEP